MVYAAKDDRSCYPGTDVLRNKAGIRDAEKLAEFELTMSLTRSEESLPQGHLDYSHYKAIHRYLFQDIYEWAGQIRTIRTGKSGHWFCYPEHIDQEMKRIFSELANQKWFTGLGKEVFMKKPAYFLADINAVHPFRDGNGRTQMMFIVLLTEYAGFKFDHTKLDQNEVLDAMISSFKGNKIALIALIALFGKLVI